MTALRIFLRQFQNSFFYLLIAAAIISLFLGERLDTMVITVILFVNASLGFIQEYRSQKLLKKLELLIDQKVRVRRGGEIVIVSQKNLQLNDLIVIESGDRIPADVVVTKTQLLQTDESAITGESLPVAHTIGDKLFMGSSVVDGTADGKVVALGGDTEFGKISAHTMQISTRSQFEEDVDGFSKKLMVIVLITLGGLLVAHLLFGRTHLNLPTLLLFIVALAIGIVPEAMPLVTTLAMTRGASLLAHQKVVVKKLAAVEDLGNIMVLCSDKTGTVTEGNMTVAGRYIVRPDFFDTACLLSFGNSGVENEKVRGAFNQAIWDSLSEKTRSQRNVFQILWEDPFDPQTRKTDVVASLNGETWAISRGAPEGFLNQEKKQKQFFEWITAQGLLGRRVLAFSGKKIENKSQYGHRDFEKNPILGFLSFSDPLKVTAKNALEEAERLGVDVRLITGDSPEVAFAVGKQLGMIEKRTDVMTGPELDALQGAAKHDAILNKKIFARIYPIQKEEIVRALSVLGPVGFIGDGVNDAPALKAATVGIAADHATDVAREAASIILLKKDLHVIIGGIRKGREIFANIEKYLTFTLIGNFGTFYSIAIISLVTPFLPMLPVQILLSNLLSDLPMITIATDRVDPDRVKKPVKSQLNRLLIFSLILGVISSLFDFLFFAIYKGNPEALLQTLWFIFSVVTELILIFSIRTRKWVWHATRPSPLLVIVTIFAFIGTIGIPLSNTGIFFHFVHPPAWAWTTLALLTAVYFVSTEISKRVFIRLAPR